MSKNFQQLYQQALEKLKGIEDAIGAVAAPAPPPIGGSVDLGYLIDQTVPSNQLYLMNTSYLQPQQGLGGFAQAMGGSSGLGGTYSGITSTGSAASIGMWNFPSTTVAPGTINAYPTVTIGGTYLETKPEKELPKGDVAGPIIAYRHWSLGGDKNTLLSGTGMVWPHGQPLKAVCSSHGYGHPAPYAGCSCGIYCFKQAHLADFEGYRTGYFGEIAIWGKVIETEKGFRAEYAYPKRLILLLPMAGFPLPKKVQTVFETLADAYGIPVYVGKELPPVRPVLTS